MKSLIKKGYRKLLHMCLSTLILSMAIWGCSKEEVNKEPAPVNPKGSMEEIRNFYNDAFVDAMVAIDFNIHTGNRPPNIEGSFLISPVIIQTSTVEGDTLVGSVLPDYLLTFSNQDNNSLMIDLKGLQGNQQDEGNGSFVTGDNGAFAVYSKTTTMALSSTAETAIAVSGVLTTEGIENLQLFGAMLDDNGDPQNIFIANNTGRLLIDSDGLSSKTN